MIKMEIKAINLIIIEPSFEPSLALDPSKKAPKESLSPSLAAQNRRVRIANSPAQITIIEMERDEIIEKKKSPDDFRERVKKNPETPLMHHTGPSESTNSKHIQFNSIEATIFHNKSKVFADQKTTEKWGKLHGNMQSLLWKPLENLSARQRVNFYNSIKACIKDHDDDIDVAYKTVFRYQDKKDMPSKMKASQACKRIISAEEDVKLLEGKAKEVKNTFGLFAKALRKMDKTLKRKNIQTPPPLLPIHIFSFSSVSTPDS
ncbi:MAG: hypothetical protein ACI9S8_002066 [Chlamydiales bacterium]